MSKDKTVNIVSGDNDEAVARVGTLLGSTMGGKVVVNPKGQPEPDNPATALQMWLQARDAIHWLETQCDPGVREALAHRTGVWPVLLTGVPKKDQSTLAEVKAMGLRTERPGLQFREQSDRGGLNGIIYLMYQEVEYVRLGMLEVDDDDLLAEIDKLEPICDRDNVRKAWAKAIAVYTVLVRPGRITPQGLSEKEWRAFRTYANSAYRSGRKSMEESRRKLYTERLERTLDPGYIRGGLEAMINAKFRSGDSQSFDLPPA